jgi:hypothetical protein
MYFSTLVPVTVIVFYTDKNKAPSVDQVFKCKCGLFSIQQIVVKKEIDRLRVIGNIEKMVAEGINPCTSMVDMLSLGALLFTQPKKEIERSFREALRLVKPFFNDPVSKEIDVVKWLYLPVCHYISRDRLATILKEEGMPDVTAWADFLLKGEFSNLSALTKAQSDELKANKDELKAKDDEIKAMKNEIKALRKAQEDASKKSPPRPVKT